MPDIKPHLKDLHRPGIEAKFRKGLLRIDMNESVSAIGSTRLVDVEVEDTACVLLKFKNGGAEAKLSDQPESKRLGVIDQKTETIANMYRTDIVLGKIRA